MSNLLLLKIQRWALPPDGAHRLHLMGAIKWMLFVVLFMLAFLPTLSEAATLVRPPNNLGLVGYWSLNEGRSTTAGDSSGQGYTGTLTNFALSGAFSNWTSSGKRGGALTFDGSNDYMNLGSSSRAILSGATTYSVGFWVKSTSTSSMVSIGSYNGFTPADPAIFVTLNRGSSDPDVGKIYVGARDNADQRLEGYTTSATNFNNGSWHHIVVTVNITASTMVIYLDGVSLPVSYAIQTSLGSLDPLLQDLYIGALNNVGTPSTFFSGSLDDIRIYNRALTAAQVASLYQSGAVTRKQVSGLGLVGYWSFNEGTSTTAGDSSGQGNTGTLTNFALSGATSNWTTAGKKGGALTFDGVDDRVNLGSPSSLDFSGVQPFTLSAWIKPTSIGAIMSVISKYGSNKQYTMNIRDTGRVQCLREVTPYNLYGNTVLTVNTWYFISCVYDGTNMYVYLNGRSDGTPVALGSVSSQSTNVNIGNSSNNEEFAGLIDEARIYNRALSAVEIQNLYRQNETRINSSQNNELTDGLVGLWSFNGADTSWSSATAGVVYDRSGQGNNGTLTNMSRTTSPTSGRVGQGMLFDGSDDYVSAPDTAANSMTSTMSAAVWVKGVPQDNKIVLAKYNSSAQRSWYIGTTNSSWGVGINKIGIIVSDDGSIGTSNTKVYTSTNIAFDNAWHHIAFTYNAGTLVVYLDGAAETTFKFVDGPITTIFDSTASVTIGAQAGLSNYFAGSIDEPRVYNRVLSAAEIKQLYNLGK